MFVLLTGATGAVGRDLAPALRRAGHGVLSASRRPDLLDEDFPEGYESLVLDLDGPVEDGRLDDVEAAYYLVHALDQANFAELDRRRAEAFARAWGRDRPVVYLGGLGADASTSEHLDSRHEVGRVLAEHCDTIELRASIVIGPHSISFELLHALSRFASCGLVPTIVPVPMAASAKTQPIAQCDLTRILVEALTLEPGVYDIGGPEVLSFADLIERGARAQGRRIETVPVIPIGGDWVAPAASLVADTDMASTVALFASMGVETLVREGHEPPGIAAATTGVDEAIAQAIAAA